VETQKARLTQSGPLVEATKIEVVGLAQAV
jgi:hypothetical protein